MIGNKKIIGVCLTKVQSIMSTEYLSRLHKYAAQLGYKIIVFNSPVDFYNRDRNDSGAETVYRLINFDIVDAVVILGECFYNDKVYGKIIDEANEHDRPVILIKRQEKNCYCILNDYKESYKEVMTHVIRDHGVTDTVFIAGRKENDEGSDLRIECYKAALKETGLEFSEELVEYGEYWEVPTVEALQKIFRQRGRYPRAVFCANDYMAIAACKEIERNGFKIPQDVIVTGFDGVPEAEYCIPQLTTCKEDYGLLAKTTIQLLTTLFDGKQAPAVSYNKFQPYLAESCGCSYHGISPRIEAHNQYSMVHDLLSHDDFVFEWLSKALETKGLNAFLTITPKLAVGAGYLCFNSDITSHIVDNKPLKRDFPFTEQMDIIESLYNVKPEKIKSFRRADIIPFIDKWAEDENDMCIVSTIYSGSNVYGYYCVKSENIYSEAHRINRSLNALNVAFNSVENYYKQRVMLLGLKNAALTDHLTGLPNLKGTTQWFENFSQDPKNHLRPLTISVYGLPKYKYIYENYGIREIEDSICFVADTLKNSNRDDAFIGHVTDDEFLVINCYDSVDQIPATIDDATSKFYGKMNKFNADGNKEYFLEVNAGCAELYPGWNGTLESFSKLAGNAMYLNRLNNNQRVEQTVTKAKIPAEIYKSFELLIEKNLFTYHFQPIVDAKNGDIIAYEALMRPDRSINMHPEEVIQTAVEYDRLYDIEKATMFNVLKIFSERPGDFKGRKLFVNSIPGNFLHGMEYDDFLSKYEKYLDDIVVEITEGSTVSDDELKLIRGINDGSLTIAIDDYGSGHSNIVNLLRYSPQIIKIDRFLISGIDKDTNKQLFFRSTVEFAGINGIKVLAEGVETADELCCVIDLGADLIQGYYTGRPSAQPADEIDPQIKENMIVQNSRIK